MDSLSEPTQWDYEVTVRYKLMPEYGCSPVWKLSDGPAENVPISELPLSTNLRESIKQWDDIFQATFKSNNPADSGFGDLKAGGEFLGVGESLVEEIRRELPGVDIEYCRIDV